MQAEEILITDLLRILFGERPPLFFVEVVIRTVVVFLLALFALRLMGSRMASRLNRNEMAALVSLAAAIGVPLQAPERGLLPAVVIAVVIVLIGRSIAARAFRSQTFEKRSLGNADILVGDGVLYTEVLARLRISRERVYAQLRSEGIRHLGMVQRLYLEANGSFSVVRAREPKPGLSVLPAWDISMVKTLAPVPEVRVCARCGHRKKHRRDDNEHCGHCGAADWTQAVR